MDKIEIKIGLKFHVDTFSRICVIHNIINDDIFVKWSDSNDFIIPYRRLEVRDFFDLKIWIPV